MWAWIIRITSAITLILLIQDVEKHGVTFLVGMAFIWAITSKGWPIDDDDEFWHKDDWGRKFN